MRHIDRAKLLDQLLPVVRAAGDAVMAIYQEGGAQVAFKADASPVTEADLAAHRVLAAGLAPLLPDCPVVSEEDAASLAANAPLYRFWLVDPLDGTKEFIGRNGEFTVNVALIEQGEPVMGVVLAPALGQLYAGGVGLGAFREDALGRHAITVRSVPTEGLTVVGSRSHGDAEAMAAFLKGKQVASVRSAGSSLKLCLVAAGEADLYPRLGRTMEWDIAAGHAVLIAAGGTVCDLQSQPLSYGKPGWDNPHFIACGSTATNAPKT